MPMRWTNLLLVSLLTFYLGTTAMAYPTFKCAYEKDHNPPLDQEAEQWFQQARAMEKSKGLKNWPQIQILYEKAIAKNHWKAMYNMARLYRIGLNPNQAYAGIPQDTPKMVGLYAKMMKLGVPLGYYSWSVSIQKGYVPDANKGDAASYMFKAAELGSPLAQVSLGNYFSFSLPKGQQRDDIADQYFKCAGAQDNGEALLEVAEFYYVSKKNMPLSLYYYQKAASVGEDVGFMYVKGAFAENPPPLVNFGYQPDPQLAKMYNDMYYQLRRSPDLKFPNLLKDHPLPRHPTQGYDADNPDVRPQ